MVERRMVPSAGQLLVHMDTTCGSLLRELQHIWDEIGESEAERDRMLLELEKECLEVYCRKVDQASHSRAKLHQSLADKEAELASLIASIGERNRYSQSEKISGTLKDQLAIITPQLEELRLRKEERMKQFTEVKTQIQKICGEISGYSQQSVVLNSINGEEEDLSLRKLDEYHAHLQALQKEKSDRLQKVLEYVNEVHGLCAVLGMDFWKTVSEVHPSLHESTPGQSKNISNKTLEGLSQTIHFLNNEKKHRIQKLHDLGKYLVELWNLMDTPVEERELFKNVVCILEASDSEITGSGALALDIIEQAEIEVERLDQLKASKMKELVLKKRMELEEICRRAHMEPDASTAPEKSNALIDAGMVDPSELLANIEAQILKAKEDVVSRKEIMDKIDKWLVACEEESWLEDYNRDENRYSASRGAHISLKRAERARVTVTKIPALVENLKAKTRAWENEKGTPFLYDGVRLLAMLEEYTFMRQEREEEKKRFRDQKRLQEQFLTEQEAIFGSKPSPIKSNSFKRGQGLRANGSTTPTNRRLSLGGSMLSGSSDLTGRVNGTTPRHNGVGKDARRRPAGPLNYVAICKDDTASLASVGGSEPPSPHAG
uniref:TSA: Wollemia nobilis Ref_Wollemi_Transcript_18801_2421 transcribed RNA sequence n=1 Tax=Wollemia nobilis TaxID=56998 RepID=A0A0C9RI64_9CONI